MVDRTQNIAVVAGLILCVATAASAQDWNGSYYGAGLGVGSGSYAQGIPQLDEAGVTVDVSGLIYGVHAGINTQNGNLVFGADAAFMSGPSGSQPQGTDGVSWSCETGECNVAVNYMTVIRAKLGYVIDRRTMVYGAGGVALASVEGGIRNSLQQGESSASGMTYALGVERITSPNTTLFGEIGMYDLGTLTFGTDNDEIEDFQAEGDFMAVRAGINIKF